VPRATRNTGQSFRFLKTRFKRSTTVNFGAVCACAYVSSFSISAIEGSPAFSGLSFTMTQLSRATTRLTAAAVKKDPRQPMAMMSSARGVAATSCPLLLMAPASPVTVATSRERNQFMMTLSALSHAKAPPKLTRSLPKYRTPNEGANPMMMLPAVVISRLNVIALRGPRVSATVPEGNCKAAYT
jgi:hypothetical protein